MTRTLPLVIVALMYASAAVYAWRGDWWPVLYWASAGTINVAATFGMD